MTINPFRFEILFRYGTGFTLFPTGEKDLQILISSGPDGHKTALLDSTDIDRLIHLLTLAKDAITPEPTEQTHE